MDDAAVEFSFVSLISKRPIGKMTTYLFLMKENDRKLPVNDQVCLISLQLAARMQKLLSFFLSVSKTPQ